jgi:hypothetical protein
LEGTVPTEFVRIRDTKTLTESSVSARRAEQLVERGGVEILTDVPAVDRLGRPLAPEQGQAPKAVKSEEKAK